MLEKFKNMGKALKDAQNMKGMMEKVQKSLKQALFLLQKWAVKLK